VAGRGTTATIALGRAKIPFTLHEYAHDPRHESYGLKTGGISPVGQKRRLPVVVDSSALELAAMFCSAGRRGLEIEIAPADLVRASGATVAPIATRP
jgi:Aminoacyl-tRNA editing domain